MDQLKVTLGRVVKIVGAEGGTAQDIVKITTFVTKISDWYPVDQAQIDLFNEFFRWPESREFAGRDHGPCDTGSGYRDRSHRRAGLMLQGKQIS